MLEMEIEQVLQYKLGIFYRDKFLCLMYGNSLNAYS